MNNFSVRLNKRDFTGVQSLPVGVTFTPGRMTWSMDGGPLECEIKATGSVASLWELAELLRNGIEILDEQGQPCWWGFIEQINLQNGAVGVAVDLENMSNKVRCRYTFTGDKNTSTETVTDWASNAVR